MQLKELQFPAIAAMRHPSICGSRKIRTFGAFCEARPLSRGLVSTAHPYFLLFDTAKLDRPDAAYLRSRGKITHIEIIACKPEDSLI